MNNIAKQYQTSSNLKSRVQNGILYVPKEYGMFLCK